MALPLATPRSTVDRLQSLLLLALPAGGQALARRNAWAGMSADAARGRERRQAEAALHAAAVRERTGRDRTRA